MPRRGIARSTCGTVFLLLLCPLVRAQPPSNEPILATDICEVLQNPDAFDQKAIRLRGRLISEFESARVDDSFCGLPFLHTSLWWDFGGTGISALQPEAKRINAITFPVLKDAEFRRFQLRFRDRRALRPDGERCHSHKECSYYDVVATYGGKFFAGRKRAESALGGFGHMGCCHLFVIEQISDVVATRTAVPSSNKEFSCSSVTWLGNYPNAPVSDFNGRLAYNWRFIAEQMRAHGDDSLVDAAEKSSLTPNVGIGPRLSWSSPDLLTIYTADFPQASPTKKKHQKDDRSKTSAPIAMTVKSEHCTALGN